METDNYGLCTLTPVPLAGVNLSQPAPSSSSGILQAFERPVNYMDEFSTFPVHGQRTEHHYPYTECLYGDCYENAFFYPVSAPNFGHYDSQHEPAFIRKRNERERQRVKFVNEGYEKLRQHLPQEYAQKRLSKVETLRAAIKHIKHLQACLRVESTAASSMGAERADRTEAVMHGSGHRL
ncbi:achaete-scute homolog 3-like [Polypterus senegalus]|nr:achaete-scute homolog 3-like [Polypterus senegalus]